MKAQVINEIYDGIDEAVKHWADTQEHEDGLIICPKGEDYLKCHIKDYLIDDGLEAFSEMNLRHERADFRKISRQIQREQWDKIKITDEVISQILQYAILGEVVYE